MIFNKRKKDVKIDGFIDVFQENVIGRTYTTHPSNTECLYLCLLLHNIKSPTSLEAEKTINNTIHPMYQSACKA